MARGTLSPAAAWAAAYRTAREACRREDEGAVLRLVELQDQRPRYTGPMLSGCAYVTVAGVVRIEGQVTEDQAPRLIAWVREVTAMEDQA